MSRRIAVLSASRADYGLLYWLARGIHEDPALTLQLVACGTHLSPEFGSTARLIAKDGLPLAAKVRTLPAGDSPAALARALGEGTARFGAAFSRLRPDLLVVLGDRFELLSACSAAVALRLPIAHLHGGESTEGVLDEQVRHAVTKLSHLHFAAAEPYRRRILRMGEDPRRVFDVGAPGLESFRRLDPLPRRELERTLRLDLDRPFLLVTVHPDSLSGAGAERSCAALLSALEDAALPAVLTYANADAGGRAVNRRLRAYAARPPADTVLVPSLGQRTYFSLLRLAAAVVGNSSSGIIEAPSARVPTVNIGERQRGRLRAPSVLDCAPTPAAIRRALRLALSPAFRRRCTGKNPYGRGDTAARVLKVLKSVPLGEALLRKSFRDAI